MAGKGKLTAFLHLVETRHTRGGFLSHTLNLSLGTGVEGWILRQLLLDRGEQEGLLFVTWVIENADVLLGLAAQHHQTGGIAAVVQDHVGGSAIAPLEDAVGVVPVLLKGLAFNSENWNARGGYGRSGVVLGGEDVAGGPAHFSPELHQGLNQNRGLNGHVQGASNAGALGASRCRTSHAVPLDQASRSRRCRAPCDRNRPD